MGDWIRTHAKPGQLVGTTELGLVSVMNMNVQFLDLRALADKTIARMTNYPHSKIGVEVDDLMNPNSVVWPYLERRRPDWLVVLDSSYGQYDTVTNNVYIAAGDFDITGDQGDSWPIKTWKRVR